MFKHAGITELSGKKGSGRLHTVMSESLTDRTLFVSVKAFPINRYASLLRTRYANDTAMVSSHLSSTLVVIVDQIDRLLQIVMYKLDSAIRRHGIALLVLYEVDLLLVDEYVCHRDVFAMMNELQRLSYVYSTKVVMVTVHRQTFAYNYNVRLSMDYFISYRYRVVMCYGNRMVEDMSSTGSRRYLYITDDHVHLDDR